MQFKHPEVLYFLFLLVIPILVHLLQLRRFKKTYFTNVKLLQELRKQTQKSSTIKKWLLLATRLLLLVTLIIAFAQPFLKAKDTSGQANELVLLLDNSFSMEAKGAHGELLKRAVQDVLESIPEDKEFSLLTASKNFWETNNKTIQNSRQQLTYTTYPFHVDKLIAQVEARKPATSKDYIIITDGLQINAKKLAKLPKENVFIIHPKAVNKTNISIENVIIKDAVDTFYEIQIVLKSYGSSPNNIPLTVLNGEAIVAKTQVLFHENEQTVTLNIPKKEFHGKVVIDDGSLTYDNTYYFTIANPEKNNVLVIGQNSQGEFLKQIITENEFNVTFSELKQLNYNSIENQQTIILNELEEIPQSLSATLQTFYNNGGNIVLIPSEKSTISNLNESVKKWASVSFGNLFSTEKEITQIHFNHPLYRDVFEKKITNFQYPKTNSSFAISGITNPVLSYADGTPFVTSISNKLGICYLFASAINKSNSNFQNSPLIVPTFYNIVSHGGNQSMNTFTITNNEKMTLDAVLSKDEVVSISNLSYSFIPIQQIANDKVKLNFGDYPEEAGNFSIYQKENPIANISFNYPRKESNTIAKPNPVLNNFININSVSNAVDKIQTSRSETSIWKWFLLATLLFLIFELLIQKFVK